MNGSAHNIITNAASTGVRIDRRRLKSLARRSDRPGIVHLALWAVAMALGAGGLVWAQLWGPFLGLAGDLRATASSPDGARPTRSATRRRTERHSAARGLNETVFWFTSLLYGEEPLHRRYTHTNHHTHTWYVGLDSQMPFDTPLDFKGWLYDISGLSDAPLPAPGPAAARNPKRYTKLMREVVAAEAELPKMTRNARIFSLVYLGVAGLIAAGDSRGRSGSTCSPGSSAVRSC